MKRISVRELRQNWPEAERALNSEAELVVTRDGKPVARLIRYENRTKKRRRFDPAKHGRWQSRLASGKTVCWVDEFLVSERSLDRKI
jgi:predicted nucleic acid-binding protein/antitoxin (DNA-binding transcriptional repressor) of toxin-antitoxin stability system